MDPKICLESQEIRWNVQYEIRITFAACFPPPALSEECFWFGDALRREEMAEHIYSS
jgi:hypothetical protein